MNRYRDLLARLGHPLAARMMDDRVASARVTYQAPPEWLGYPPALVPIMSDGPTYLGLWRHWFLPRRDSFVTLSLENDGLVTEVARTERQLATLLVVELLVLEDTVTDEVEWLARRLDVADVDEVDEHTNEHGDDPQELAGLRVFATDTPLATADPAEYDGEFPTMERTDGTRRSWFEYDPDIVKAVPVTPPWLDPASAKQSLFNQYLDAGQFADAWLTLNSPGWRFAEAARALGQLRDTAAAPSEFAAVADTWITLAAHDDSGY